MKTDEMSEENVVYSDEKRNCSSGQFHFNIKCCLTAAERGRNENNSSNVQMHSELRNWPIQLKLINPNANYFDNADLLVVADCVPFSYPNFHSRLG